MHREIVCAAPLAMEILWEDGMIQRMNVHWAKGHTQTSNLSSHAKALHAALGHYVAGKKVQWPDLPLSKKGLSPFLQKVLHHLKTIPHGSTVTYGELAAMAGSPKGARAIGKAMGMNPWTLVYPCHRVVGAHGAMTGFSASGGIPLKQFLLQLEGAIKE